MSSFKFFWTTHKWTGIIAAVVFINIGATGFLLLIKKKVAWIQPPENRGVEPGVLTVSFDDILEALRSVPEAEVESWDDVDRLDVRPGKGMLKVRCNNSMEVQIDLKTAEVLQVHIRRSDLIETIHDGSFFADWVHGWVMPVVAIALEFLVLSGLYLWLEPKFRKRRRKKKQAAVARQRS